MRARAITPGGRPQPTSGRTGWIRRSVRGQCEPWPVRPLHSSARRPYRRVLMTSTRTCQWRRGQLVAAESDGPQTYDLIELVSGQARPTQAQPAQPLPRLEPRPDTDDVHAPPGLPWRRRREVINLEGDHRAIAGFGERTIQRGSEPHAFIIDNIDDRHDDRHRFNAYRNARHAARRQAGEALLTTQWRRELAHDSSLSLARRFAKSPRSLHSLPVGSRTGGIDER